MNDRGIWSLAEAKEIHDRFQSQQLADWLVGNLDKSLPVIDFGCGIGFYCKILSLAGFNVLAYEGTPDIDKIAVFSPILRCDLSEPISLSTSSANIVCLEVGEHIPEKYENTVIDNLCASAKALVLSWAVPAQPGVGHVNTRPNEWVIEQASRRGLVLDEKLTNALRELDFDGLTYFKQSVFVFRR